jgi:heme/copper-type cytochrome/quinol oxidase subunit 2
MSGFEIVAIVIGIFFLVGMVVGVLLVVALPVLQVYFRHRRNRRRHMRAANWHNLTSRDDDNRLPRWPGG